MATRNKKELLVTLHQSQMEYSIYQCYLYNTQCVYHHLWIWFRSLQISRNWGLIWNFYRDEKSFVISCFEILEKGNISARGLKMALFIPFVMTGYLYTCVQMYVLLYVLLNVLCNNVHRQVWTYDYANETLCVNGSFSHISIRGSVRPSVRRFVRP